MNTLHAPTGSDAADALHCDVLVIGGGPAGCWAALTASEAGARVILADKGYVGTSGATAPTNSTVHYIVPDDPVQRAGMVRSRLKEGQPFIDLAWVERVYDQTGANLQRLTDWGYKWPRNELGAEFRGNLRGADYLHFLRRQLRAHGVQILDHSPALELLQADDGVAGARGLRRDTGAAWEVRAASVVLATGGCAFRSGATGTFNLTGDGYLMAGEAGAHFSGLEFTGNYAFAPADGTLTKGIIYRSASFSDADGNPVERPKVFRLLAQGAKAYAVLDKAGDYLADGYRHGQPNIFVYFDRQGSDPFRDRYPLRLYYEGTVRGSGGLLTADDGHTTVAGLFAAGDVTSRERVVGPASSGGGPASSWANASGVWAGKAAAAHAKQIGALAHQRVLRDSHSLGRTSPAHEQQAPSYEALLARVQEYVLPLQRNFFRTGDGMRESLAVLDTLWAQLKSTGATPALDTTPVERARQHIRLRELQAMVASARLFFTSALAREESRGMHKREDFPQADADAPVTHVRVAGTPDNTAHPLDHIRQWRAPLAWQATRPAPAAAEGVPA
ncbi:FAD-binding protein [Uliginosibacterium sp. H1]|uniref:FAD-binding protein n=1 Tax=Uliginosibacterium sp. H1 TaxID=3114757 RepID=UPI002E187AB1|nr:FAD-binding protein [Uliginosibacterium sp. H1]